MSDLSDWTHADHQRWERTWWGACLSTFSEEAKQITYANRMGLVVVPDLNRGDEVGWSDQWPAYDLHGANVVDLGGGPVSILLKCRNRGTLCDVVDPCEYPDWTRQRYGSAGIAVERIPAEQFNPLHEYDEAWVYNVLQHVNDPAQVLEVARDVAPVVRLFEWVGYEPSAGHPHMITVELVDAVLGARREGSAREWIDENGAQGWATYGVWEIR